MRAQISLNRRSAIPWSTLCVLCAAAMLHFWPAAAGALVYDRSAIAQGQLWRLLSGHLVHLSAAHLIIDSAAFGIVAAIIEQAGRPLGSLLLLLALGISSFLCWSLPDLAIYGGLSGISYGLFIYGAIALPGARSRWRWPAQAAAGVMVVKVFLEMDLDTSISLAPAQGFVSVPESHAAGMAIALIYHGVQRWCTAQSTWNDSTSILTR